MRGRRRPHLAPALAPEPVKVELTLRDRINAGEFENTVAYPNRVKEPEILKKTVKDLTDEEIASIPAVRAAYAADKAEYDAGLRQYQAGEGRAQSAFREAIKAEFGYANHPKEHLLWQKAWERGHSSGLTEVVWHYEDLSDFLD